MWKELIEQGHSFYTRGPYYYWKVRDSEGKSVKLIRHKYEFSHEDKELFKELEAEFHKRVEHFVEHFGEIRNQ